MNESIKRSITTGQPKMRMLCIDVDTTNVKANGFDANKILSVAKTAVGKYTITLKFPFNNQQPVTPRIFSQVYTEGFAVKPISASHSTIVVEVYDEAQALADGDFSLMIYGCDGRLTY